MGCLHKAVLSLTGRLDLVPDLIELYLPPVFLSHFIGFSQPM